MRLSDAFLSRKSAAGATADLTIMPGVTFKIAYIGGSADFLKRLDALKKKDDDTEFVAAIASDILLGWSGLEDDNGAPLEATYDARVKLLRDYIGVMDRVVDFAREPRNFTACNEGAVEGSVKN